MALITPAGKPAFSASLQNSRVDAEVEFGRFQHHGTARGQGRSQLPGGQKERRVPGRDRGHHTHGHMGRVGEHVGLVDREDRALDLVAKAGEIAEPLRQIAGLAAHFGIELAVVLNFDAGKVIGFALQNIREPVEKAASLGRVHCGPVALGESIVGRLHGAVHVVCPAARDPCPHLGGKGVVAFKILAGCRFDPFAVDVALIGLDARGALHDRPLCVS